MIWGILTGLAATLFQDAGYIFSRRYVQRHGKSYRLLLLTQLYMGIAGIAILFFVWPEHFPDNWETWVIPLCGAAFGSLFGQLFFFRAEKFLEPSRISSLMGLRVLLVALAYAIFRGRHYDLWQWGGIAVAVFSAVLMNDQNGKFRSHGLGTFACALIFYCCSDLSIKFLIDALLHRGNYLVSALQALSFVNLLLLLVTLPLLIQSKPPKEKFAQSLPFAGSWFIKQIFLYITYALIDPVFGNVILSLRGLLALVLAWSLTRLGIDSGETPTDRATTIRRIVATIFMGTAIVLYSFTGSKIL